MRRWDSSVPANTWQSSLINASSTPILKTHLILQHLGTAIPVAVNCALCGIDRVAREVCAALKRREIEVSNARKSAEAALRSELREPLTAVLLNCDLLQEMCGLPRTALEKIAVIEEKALDLASRIEVKEELATKA
jgi:hypothetical protein